MRILPQYTHAGRWGDKVKNPNWSEANQFGKCQRGKCLQTKIFRLKIGRIIRYRLFEFEHKNGKN